MANKPFAKIVRFYEAQADKFMCGPATVAIVLNALKMDSPNQLPLDSEHERFAQQMNSTLPQDYCASFARYTQKNIFDNHSRVKTLAEVYGNLCSNKLFSPGLNLSEMHELLLCHGVSSKLNYVTEPLSECHFDNICHALSSTDQYIIANFDRAIWGLNGGGHVSPIGALDLASRRALIVDVNMCGKWLWIDINLLIKSMAGLDGIKPRGYLIVS